MVYYTTASEVNKKLPYNCSQQQQMLKKDTVIQFSL